VLSGYLITKSWRGNPDFVPYIRNRILRIVPGFWVAAGVSLAIVGALGAADARTYLAAITWSDIAQIIALGDPTTPPTFENLPFPSVNGSLWTIQYEFLCYLIAPLALSRRSAVIPIWLLTVGLAIASPHPLPRFLMAFMTGAVFQTIDARPSNALILLATATFALLLPFERTWEVGAAIGGGYLALCVGQKSLPFSWPDFSYGLYLYGWPTQMLLISAGILNSWILLALALPIAAALGVASWLFVERPMLRLKRRKFAQEGLETDRMPVGGSEIASAV
jgi:peptidoglycan/LPS O-acetylase OafA/YrhL